MSGTSQPVKPFLGVRFVLLGFDSINESKIRTKLIDGGGVDSAQYNPNCTHVIVDKIVYDDPLCVMARKDCKTVVMGLWVDHSYDIGTPVDFTSIMYRPPKDLNGIPGAKGLVMCLTGYQRQDRDDIMTLVSLMGAQFSKPLVANKVTHLICYKFEGEKYELGKKLSRIKLVNHRWLEDCLKEWEILPETNYNKSGFELEIMEAEAKDSEEEAEDTSLKQSAMENIPRSPYSSKPSPPQLHSSPKLKAVQVDGPAIASNPKDKFPVQGIDNRSGQSSGLENVSITKASGYNGGLGAPNPATYSELAQPQYQSPFRKHATNDFTPKSQRTEITTPLSDGRFSGASYSRKTQRSLRDLSSNHSAFVMDAPKVDDPLPSFDKLGGSKTFESPKSGYNSLSVEKSTVYSPMKNVLTNSYSIPIQQSTGDGVKLCIRKSPSPSEKVHGSDTSFFDNLHSTDINLGSVGNNECPNTANHEMNSRSTDVTMLESVELSDQNEKSAPQSFKRLKKSSSGFADLEKLDGEDSKRQGDDVKEPQNHQSYVKGSAVPEGDGKSKTKPLRKKMVAKKTLGSRSKIVSEANKKGSLFLDKRSAAQDEAVSEKPAQSFSCEAAKTNKTENGSKSKENALWPTTETVNDETETPEDRMEQVLVKVADQVNFSTVELAEKSDTVKESEIVSASACLVDAKHPKPGNQEDANILPPVEPKCKENKILSATACPVDPKPGSQEDANISAPAEPKSKENEIVSASACPVDPKPGNQEDADISAPVEPKSKGVGLKRNRAKEKAPTVGKNRAKEVDVTEGVESKEPGEKPGNGETNVVKDEKKKTVKYPVTKSKRSKSEKSSEEEKENTPVETETKAKEDDSKRKVVTSDEKALLNVKENSKKISPKSWGTIGTVANAVREEPVTFILSGHRLQRKEFQKVIRRLKGKFCRDSHQWSYQATHFIVPDPIRRTEKFFAAAASGRWILKTDYLTASNEAGKFVDEESYEWHKNGLNEDGAINLEAPRKWRLLRQRTGHGAFHGMRIIIYGECIAPSLDTLKRVVKAGDGTILATSPPYTRFLNSGVDFAVVSPGMPRVDAWVQEFLNHEVPCVVADYLVEYVCKPGYSLEKHSLYNTHSWAQRSFARLQAMAEETVVDPDPEVDPAALSPGGSGSGSGSESDVACQVCGSRNREEVMLICGDESGSSGCGVGCHIDCCEPPMEEVPEDDWFCSECRVKRNTTIAEKVSIKKRKKCASLKSK